MTNNQVAVPIIKAARAHDVDYDRISFKGTIATLRQWAPIIATTNLRPRDRARIRLQMLNYIARDPVPDRPDRTEPRALKRRPKNYQRMTKPRRLFKETPHRGKKRGLK